MMRKIIMALLLLTCLQSKLFAAPGDSVTISIPPYTDTTCFLTQLQFTHADTFAGTTVRWFVNGVYSGVSLDTFFTSAPNDGDSVYCMLYLAGGVDSTRSNAITIHRTDSVNARALISLIAGSNPDCAGNPLTFFVYPVNGGTNPRYQWMINGTEVAGSDSNTFSRVFGGADTITCRMISNSPCAPEDTVYSTQIPIIHIHLTASIYIVPARNPICKGDADTFTAYAFDYGTGVAYQWYVNTTAVPGAVTNEYITDSLNNNDSVYCVITTTDTCVLNPVTRSNAIYMRVFRRVNTSAFVNLIAGSNPGCLDSLVTLEAIFDSFGFAPYYEWTINGVPTAINSDTITRAFANNDRVSFTIYNRDGGCYVRDTIVTPDIYMIRDSTPATPLVSLIGNLLIVNEGSGTYRWYYNTTNTDVGSTLIPGATGPTYHAVTLGYYYAIKDSSYCPSLRSNIIYISLLGINDVFGASVSIYPNPTKGGLQFNWGTLTGEMKVEVYNAAGSGITYQSMNTQTMHTLDLSYLPTGTYYLVLRDKEGKAAAHTFTISK